MLLKPEFVGREEYGVVSKVMSVPLIKPFDRLRNHPSTGSGTTRRNDCYTKCGGFDKFNHRNANLLDRPFVYYFPKETDLL